MSLLNDGTGESCSQFLYLQLLTEEMIVRIGEVYKKSGYHDTMTENYDWIVLDKRICLTAVKARLSLDGRIWDLIHNIFRVEKEKEIISSFQS